MHRSIRSALLAAAGLIAVPFSAEPQEAAPAAGTTAIEKITVTAQKRAETSQDVPITLTALPGVFLEDQGITDFERLSALVPGFQVQIQSQNNPGFVIRGLTSDTGESNQEPRVSVYLDGVSIARPRGSVVELFDIDRVEVLKGPQSTLFGRAALIGAVNVIQGKARQGLEANLTVAAGTGQQRRVTAMVNGGVTDAIALRLAGTHRFMEGIVENRLPAGIQGPGNLNGVDLFAARAGMTWEVNDRLTFTLIGFGQKDNPTGTAFKSGAIPAFQGNTNPFSHASLNIFRGAGANDLLEGGRNLGIDRTMATVQLLAEYRINDAWTLNLATAHRRFNSLEVFDADGAAFNLILAAEDAQSSDLSQEVRFNYETDTIKAFFGANVFHEDGYQRAPLATDERQFFTWNNGAPAAIPVPSPLVAALVPGWRTAAAAAFGAGDPTQGAYQVALAQIGGLGLKPFHIEEFQNFGETTSFDLFADIAVDVTPDVTLTAGVRWTHDDKTTKFRAQALNGPSVLAGFLAPGLQTLAVANTGGLVQSRSETFSDFVWRFVAEWRPADDVNLFASYARGRAPEIIDVVDTNPVFGGFQVLPAETVDSFEIGAKGEFLDRSLSLEGSVFFYEYENFQASRTNPVTGLQERVNAGGASSYGLEMQARWRPVAWFEGFLTYGYNHSRFDSSALPAFANGRFRLNPDHSASIGADIEAAYDWGTLFVRPLYTWQSKVQFADGNAPLTQDAYGLASLRAGWESAEGGWRITAFADNLFDEEYLIDRGNTGQNINSATNIRGLPQMFGLELTARY